MAAEFSLTKKSRSKCDMMFKEARNKYMESKSNILSPSTISGYKQMDTYFEYIDDIKLSKLSQEHIQIWANDFSSNHSPKTVRNAHGYISAIIKKYKPSMELNTTLPQKVTPIYYVPSDSELKKIIDYLMENDHEMLKAVYLSAFGTLRRSEICGLDASTYKGIQYIFTKL